MLNDKTEIQNELNLMLRNKSMGAFVRSRAQWCEEGEQCTRYFVNLEKQTQCYNVIDRLKSTDNQLLTSNSEILEEAASYYEQLYKTRNISTENIDNYLNNVIVNNKLSENEKFTCDENISLNELSNVISKLNNNKSPGLDGLTPEFYKHFWDELKYPFLNMIRESFDKGIMPDSMRRAVVALLFKKGDRELLKNYRPISLMNYDYKILAFCLAVRMQKVMSNIISGDQTAYIKGRYIGNNARFLQDIIDYTENNKIPGFLISLDFEKAFDTLDWNFMLKCLQKFNFGEKFLNWIKILYKQPNLIIKNNGHFSRDVSMCSGIRQGCPVSALLFLLAVEIMSIDIKNNKDIKGIFCNNTEHKISQYADDSNLIIADIESIRHSINCVNKFSNVAGPKLNLAKTEGILLGTLKNAEIDSINNICFVNKPIKCLGIFVGHNLVECEELNWNNKIDCFEKTLSVWSQRKLTMFGKVVVINNLAISKLIYYFTLLHVPEWVIIRIEKAITFFYGMADVKLM